MTAKAKKQSKLAWIAVCALVLGVVLYLISSLIFPSKASLGWQVFAATAVALLLLAVVAYAGDTVPAVLRDVCIIGGGLAILAAISFFVLNRLDPAADIWFIPVNYPAAEKTSLYISCAGLACYCVAFIATTVKAFAAKN